MRVDMILDVDLPNNQKIYILGDVNNIPINNKPLMEFMCLLRGLISYSGVYVIR